MTIENNLFVEKYRPRTINDCILPQRLKSFFNDQIRCGKFQNMLLHGGPGLGKTTAARALCSELGVDVLFLNASSEGRIEDIRTQVKTFVSTVSFNVGMIKCVILDESDGLSSFSQNALKTFIEDFSANARFIFTANIERKIIDPIKSRCVLVDFNLTREEKKVCVIDFNRRAKEILDAEGIEYDRKELAKLIMAYFPDYRRILNAIQRCSIENRLSYSKEGDAVQQNSIDSFVTSLKEKKFNEIEKWLNINPEFNINDLIPSVYTGMREVIRQESILELIIILNKYDYQQSFCVDKNINILAMVAEIFGTISFKGDT